MQKGVAYKCRQNEYSLHTTAICTCFLAICCKMRCNMPQNTLHFGAKRGVFWCKTQCILVQNAVHFGAKRKVKCGKMGDEKHKNTYQGDRQDLFEPLKNRTEKGQNIYKKWSFRS